MKTLRTAVNPAGWCALLALSLLLPAIAWTSEPAKAPTPYVTAKRQGRLLTLDCQLRDAGGRKYTSQTRTNPPRFAIYQGDREIASGSFEYG